MAYSNAERQARWRAKNQNDYAGLRFEINKLRNKVKRLDDDVAELLDERRKLRNQLYQLKKAEMPQETFRAVMKCLHPDAQPTDKQRAAACALFNAWKDVT